MLVVYDQDNFNVVGDIAITFTLYSHYYFDWWSDRQESIMCYWCQNLKENWCMWVWYTNSKEISIHWFLNNRIRTIFNVSFN